MNYFLGAECNVYRIKIGSQLIGKIFSNIILKCASALFYGTRQPYLPTEKKDQSKPILTDPSKYLLIQTNNNGSKPIQTDIPTDSNQSLKN